MRQNHMYNTCNIHILIKLVTMNKQTQATKSRIQNPFQQDISLFNNKLCQYISTVGFGTTKTFSVSLILKNKNNLR